MSETSSAPNSPMPQNSSPFRQYLSGSTLTWLGRAAAAVIVVYFGYTTFVEQKVVEKIDIWNGALYCFNTSDGNNLAEISKYTNGIDFDSPQETTYTGYTGAGNLADWPLCESNLNEAVAKNNQHPQLNAAIVDFRNKGKALVEGLTAIAPYYKQKNYLTDGFARGKAEDTKLQAIFADYQTASTKFGDVISQVEDIQTAQDIEKFKADPERKNEVYVLEILSTSKKIMKALSSETINIQALPTENQTLSRQVDAFKNKILNNLKTSAHQSRYQTWNRFTEKVDNYLASSKQVESMAKAGAIIDVNDPNLDPNFVDAVNEALDGFDDIIQNYNSINSVSDNYPL